MDRKYPGDDMIHWNKCISRVFTLWFGVGAFVLPASLAQAQGASPEERGLAIAVEARERGRGFGNFTASQTMVLRNRQGQESLRELRVKVLEVEGDGNRSLFVFDVPRDVAGTAFLIHMPGVLREGAFPGGGAGSIVLPMLFH